jgi:FKBP-type peptidyl-prolyl cis-trans isomerase SlyD
MIKQGSNVKLHYTLSVEGEQIESSRNREPAAYVHGEGKMIRGLEEQLEGKEAGDKVSATVTPDKGYGEHRPDLVQRVDKSAFTDSTNLEPGVRVSGQVGERPFQATITEVGTHDVALDMNHPLAGKTLEFEVEIVEVH